MDQIERLLGLYRGAQTESERRILLETARISNPADFPRLEEMILRDQVRQMNFEQLIQQIASHRRIILQQADELLRDAVFDNLLDRAKLKIEESARTAPAHESRPAPGATVPGADPPPAALSAEATAAATARNGAPQKKAVEVIIIPDPDEREAVPTVIGNVKPEGDQNGDSTAPPARTSFRRLQPRGIGG